MSEKLHMQTANQANENFKKLAALFPNAVTETINEDGEVIRAIDKDILMQEINTAVVDGRESKYQFTWPDKREAIIAANESISETLRPDKDESKDFDTTQNLYIEGNNLPVLKLLLENYLGAIKLIYIDPPYNTGEDFVYRDNFAMSLSDYKVASGQVDDEGLRLFQNGESNGRFHTDWLNMMYPRLKVARNLLADDGVIFISIDSNEVVNLRKICDEIFGASNFVGEIIWQTATDNNPRQISIEHEYIICYAKNKNNLGVWTIESEKAKKIIAQYRIIKRQTSNIAEQQRLLREWIKKNEAELKGVTHYNNVDEKGVYSNSSNSSNTKPGGYTFDIIHPVTGKPCAKPAFGWRWTEKTFWAYADNGDIEWGKDESTQPRVKKRIETVQEQFKSIYYEDGRASTKQLENIFGAKKIFDNPKSVALIKRIIAFCAQGDDDIILDFFSGSGTTAHAVMELNSEDGHHRKFIMVQVRETIEPDKEAYKAGFRNICEIGKERIRRAGKQIKESSNDKTLDVGFRVLKLDSSNMEDVFYTPQEVISRGLWDRVDNIKPDRTPEDLLFQPMLELDVPLSAHIEEETIDGKKVFVVEDGYIIACFDQDLTDEIIEDIAKRQPYYFVTRDSSLADDSVAVNFEQLFKSYSPKTVIKVL